MSRGLRLVGWLAVLALGGYSISALGTSSTGREDGARPAEHSVARRLLGPFASLAARGQWVRVHGAMLSNREDLVFQRAETAFELDPGATEGWIFLARHLFFDRASLAREPDPARRAAWMQSAIEIAERGEARAREPEQLALWLGLARVRMATDEHLVWPERAGETAGGVAEGDAGAAGAATPRALLLRAAEDFERAARAGDPDGAELARNAVQLAEALR